MADNFKLITDKETELKILYDRMDKDRKAVRLNAYTLTGFDLYKDKEIPRTVSVTMNDPQVFANAITAILQQAKRQTEVEGLSDTQNKLVEDFINDMFYSDEERLSRRIEFQGLWKWICNHVSIRGPIGARFTWDKDGSPNCLPTDMRYCPFEIDADGLSWVANKSRRTSEDLKKKYGDLKFIPEGKDIIVYDLWDSIQNEIYANGHKIFDQENIYKEPPFVIRFPTAGYMLLDEGYMEYAGESIFAAVRDLYPEWNRLMSIQQTKALEIVKPPYAHPVVDPAGDKQAYPHQIGGNMEYNPGEKPELLETQDITNAFRSSATSFSNAIQKGSINEGELGATGLDRTAVWLNEQTEIRNKIMTPRFECLTSFMQGAAYMRIKQFISHKFDKPVSLGRRGFKKEYTADSLGNPDDYSIEFKLMPDNTRQKLANYTVGISLKGTLSEDTIIRDIYQCDDPDGEIDKLRAEEARKSNPIIFYFDEANRLIDVAEKKKGDEKKRYLKMAQIMADSMVEEIKRRKVSSVDQQSQPGTQDMQLKTGSPNALLAMPSMMGKGGGGRTTQKEPAMEAR